MAYACHIVACVARVTLLSTLLWADQAKLVCASRGNKEPLRDAVPDRDQGCSGWAV